MAISDRLIGTKNTNSRPHLESVDPGAALPGGDVVLRGSNLRGTEYRRPLVTFQHVPAHLVVSGERRIVARVPEGATSGPVVVTPADKGSNPLEFRVATPVAENLHPVANPALDEAGNIYATFSGSRGQKVPVSIYKIDPAHQVRPFVSDLMNPTGIAFDRAGQMYVSSRNDGTVYRVAQNGTMASYAEGMGVATGIAFDEEENLYVGDRSGTIFRIGRDRQIFVYATLEPSVSAYHLAFGPEGTLYVAGPTTSSYDCIYAIDRRGDISTFYRGLGRPQGLAFDIDGNLYVAASLRGRRGIVRITPEREASLAVAGQNLVGLAFAPGGAMVLATNNAVFHLSIGVEGRPLV